MQKFKKFKKLKKSEAKLAVSRSNPDSPFSRFIGNRAALKKLQVIAYTALRKEDHCCRDLALAFFGPASVGKTTLAKLTASTLELPFVEISPKAITTLDDLFEEINRVLTVEEVGLADWGDNFYYLPPCIIFIDEIHALAKGMIHGLLKATEHNDGMLVTEKGKTLNCHNACWMIATTDEGRLFDAFRTRFSPINLVYLTKREVARIVKLNNPNLPFVVCELIAFYNSRIPRQALAFARYMKLLKSMNPDDSWEKCAREVAKTEGIDEYGMSSVHLSVLKVLANGAVAKNRIPVMIGSKIDEVENFIMPWLLIETEEQPALVKVTHAGYVLTPAGIHELEKRARQEFAKWKNVNENC